jgi:hypothetical protein
MKETEIIELLRNKLGMPGGRHLYGVLGSYKVLNSFAQKLQQVKNLDGVQFAKPKSVNKGILDEIPDDEFRLLAANEAKRPEPTAAFVNKAFETFLRRHFSEQRGLLILQNLEMLFTYHLELNMLRTLAADQNRVLLLLPGKRISGKIVMFPELTENSYILPTNLIADNHLWELTS